MKYLVILALFLLTSCTSRPYATVRAATFLVHAQGGIGSAVHIGHGYFITAAHVQNGTKVTIVNRLEGATYVTELIKVDLDKDLCLVRIKRKDLPKVDVAKHELEIGEVVIATGYHYGETLLTTQGIKSGIVGASSHHYTSDAEVNPGTSGGPLVNEDGELIGIIQAKSGGLSFYAGSKVLKKFLKGSLEK
jgi:S1-C subfamily serine protease